MSLSSRTWPDNESSHEMELTLRIILTKYNEDDIVHELLIIHHSVPHASSVVPDRLYIPSTGFEMGPLCEEVKL